MPRTILIGTLRVAAILALATPVLLSLGQRVRDVVETPLTAERADRPAVPIELGYAGKRDGVRVATYRLHLVNPEALARQGAVELLTADYGAPVDLHVAELAIEGTRCVYRTTRGARFPSNDYLRFERGEACTPNLEGSPTGYLQLRVSYSGNGRLALWTYREGVTAPQRDVIYAPDEWDRSGAQLLEVRGRYVDDRGLSRYRRADLLAAMWEVSEGSRWIWILLAIAAVFWWVGTRVFWRPLEAGSPRRRAIAAGGGAFCLALAVGLLYAVLTPPFHAADEPTHFVAFGAAIGRPSLADEATEWASLGHFERLQFHPEERFRPSDMDGPGHPWNDGTLPNTTARGGGVYVLWRALGPFVHSVPAPRLLLVLRAFNALLMALTIGTIVTGMVILAGVPQRHLLALPLLLIPGLAFFGMHVSNHATLLLAYLVFAAGVLLLVLDGDAPGGAGLAIGAGWGSALALSRSAVPLAAFIAVILAGRLILGGRQRHPVSSVRFWLSLAAPVSLAFGIGDFTYLRIAAAESAAPEVQRVGEIADFLTTYPWIFVGTGIACAGLEIALQRVRAALRAPGPRLRRAVTAVMFAGAAAVAISLVGSVIWIYPELRPLNGEPRLAAQYVQEALRAGLTIFRLRYPDHLTSTSFWAGFGWLDTLPPAALTSALAGATGVSLIFLLVRIGRQGAVRRAAWLVCAGVGFVAGLGGYALSVIVATPADLHGRYLLGLYVPMVLICWSPLAEWRGTWKGRDLSGLVAITCALAIAIVHGYCLAHLVRRYF